jgi:hypothetical protein
MTEKQNVAEMLLGFQRFPRVLILPRSFGVDNSNMARLITSCSRLSVFKGTLGPDSFL